MNALRTALLVLASLGSLYYILSTYALAAHFRKRRKPVEHAEGQPRVSVLKPLCGLDAEARENFLTFLNQDYPDYEVLFGVLDEDDSSLPMALDAIEGCSHASLHIGSDIDGPNNKVRILHNLAGHANGNILVVTDADTRVGPEFLRAITASFADESVGVVTCIYRGVEAKSTADALEGLHMTCVFEPGVACAYALGVGFGLGAAIAIRRSTLEAVGGFKSIVEYLADDYQLAKRAARAGKQVTLSDYVVDIVFSGEGLRSVLARDLRWFQTVRVSNPLGYAGLAVTYGFAYAALFWLLSGFSAAAWSILLGVMAVRLATAYVGARRRLGDKEFVKRAYLLPVCDLLAFGAWIAAFFSRTVDWRGRKLRLLKDGKISRQH
jgi:ceramide glucosyltransferase